MHHDVAHVFVNNIEVGSLPVCEYQQLVKSVRKSKRLYVIQLFNWLVVAMRCGGELLIMLPVYLVGLMVCVAFVAPDALSAYFTAISKLTPEQLVQTVRALSGALSVVYAMYLGGRLLVKGSLAGYVNQFEAEVNERVRTLLEVPAEGAVRVEWISISQMHG